MSPDVPYQPEPEPTRSEKDRELAAKAAEHVAVSTRQAITGDPKGSIRRPVLFVVAAVAFLFAAQTDPWAAAIGFPALMILMLTDQVVAL